MTNQTTTLLSDKIREEIKKEYETKQRVNGWDLMLVDEVTKLFQINVKQTLKNFCEELKAERFDCKINTDFSKRKRIIIDRKNEGDYLEYEKVMEILLKHFGEGLMNG